MTEMFASCGEVDIVNLIGNQECSKTPPSRFNADGTMIVAGPNASPFKVLREETGVKTKSSALSQSATETICRLTDNIHLCCDGYNPLSLKSLEPQHRYARSRPARQFEIIEHYTVHDTQ